MQSSAWDQPAQNRLARDDVTEGPPLSPLIDGRTLPPLFACVCLLILPMLALPSHSIPPYVNFDGAGPTPWN